MRTRGLDARLARGVVIAVAAAMAAAVFAVRLVVDDPAEPILFLMVVPIGLVAVGTGLRGGLAAALIACSMVVIWDAVRQPDLTPVGYASRYLVFLLTGTTAGFLASSQRRLQEETSRWFDQAVDLNCVADFDGNFVRVNRAFQAVLGYPERTLLSTPYVAHVHPEDRKETAAAAAALAGGQDKLVDFENRYRAADGTYRWLRWTASADPARRLIYASARDVTTTKRLEDELREMAHSDPLTGLSNRRHFEAEAVRQLDFLRRYGPGGALFVLDIDSFKDTNDTYGHAAGDDALRGVAAAMRTRIRASDVCGRIGGDEFAVLFPGAGPDEARMLGAQLLDAIRALSVADGTVAVTASVGAVAFPRGTTGSVEELLSTADETMYLAKRAGGDRFSLTELDDEAPASAPRLDSSSSGSSGGG